MSRSVFFHDFRVTFFLAFVAIVLHSCGVQGGGSLVNSSGGGGGGTAVDPNANVCNCPATFSADSSGLYCKKTNSTSAPGAFINANTGVTNGAYGPGGGRLFSFSQTTKYPYTQSGGAITDNNATTITLTNLAPAFWQGRLNAIVIEAAGQLDNTNYDISFCLNVPAAREYVFGIAADNGVALSVGGKQIFRSSIGGSDFQTFDKWWLGAINLNAGNNSINFVTSNAGGSKGFAFEFYRNTKTEVENATALADLTVIKRSTDYVGQAVFAESGTTCTGGAIYNACTNQCESISTTDCL